MTMMSNKLIISPSKLETFRKFYLEEMNGYFTEAMVLKQLRGEEEWTPRATFGSAFHAALEHGPEAFYRKIYDPHKNDFVGIYRVRDNDMPEAVICSQHEMQMAREFRSTYPEMVYEVKAKKWLEVGEYQVRLNMRIDGMNGLEVHEQKTTEHQFNYDEREQSLQWKVYALATDAHKIQYNVWNYRTNEDGSRSPLQYNSIKLFPYAGIQNEVIEWVRLLIDFAKYKDVLVQLQSRY